MSRTRALFISCLFSGCVVQEDPTVTDVPRISPNGHSLTGVALAGIRPTGVTLNGVAPTGTTASGTPLSIAVTGSPLSGTAAVGSQWIGHLSDGTNLTLRIEAAQPAISNATASSDVWSYRVAALTGTTWKSICVDAAGNPSFADVVSGTWNLAQGVSGGGGYLPTTADFTFACRGSAAAKCVELGYKPWAGQRAALASCVRALRGDYCGDGTPYTVDGTEVNMFDVAGTLPDGMAWEPEAEWTPDGATCVSKKKETRFSQDAHIKPACFPHSLKAKKSCGTAFSDGVAIITELPPN